MSDHTKENGEARPKSKPTVTKQLVLGSIIAVFVVGGLRLVRDDTSELKDRYCALEADKVSVVKEADELFGAVPPIKMSDSDQVREEKTVQHTEQVQAYITPRWKALILKNFDSQEQYERAWEISTEEHWECRA